ncbi:dipeptide/oligopeptide/nickel ABC transporter ATP-binding protein [Compostibacillus humi]|uniref:Dipeptide/oligopeptide/nickel ABC transporter ATP-binding protein n=1 Tax=Compostibacillus humi TaxID=1245525 RepID=A0A8J2TP57_9BACI|nr:ABC transporter ATP-binding protein [Compostibacillus humi]GFZ82199.1 dipeptide/oligopeptide/nickel ABC transporter ATP-binding protein [Compostibacillus humi]
MTTQSVLSVESLTVEFNTSQGNFQAVRNVSFELKEGEILGIVGESGCGKSVTSLSVMGLLPKRISKITDGHIYFQEQDLVKLKPKQLRKIRGKDISMVFQEPMTSLNPVYTIGDQIGRIIKNHEKDISRKEVEARVVELLKQVGIPRPDEIKDEYPHQLSGGMRQRVMIAMAISCNPKVLIADEPTTALDVTIQAQILELLKKLTEERKMSLILITHDLGVVAEMCDRVLVMYSGQVVEKADKEEFFTNPKHPYSKGLLASIPEIGKRDQDLHYIKGNVPHPSKEINGCRYQERCEFFFEKCLEGPKLLQLKNGSCRCWLYEEEEV